MVAHDAVRYKLSGKTGKTKSNAKKLLDKGPSKFEAQYTLADLQVAASTLASESEYLKGKYGHAEVSEETIQDQFRTVKVPNPYVTCFL